LDAPVFLFKKVAMRSAFNGIPFHRGQGNASYAPQAANRPTPRGQEYPYDTNRAPAGLFTTISGRSFADSSMRFSVDASGNVTISAHDRVYADKAPVAVDGTPGTAADGTGGTPIAAGGANPQYVLIYYDDPTRVGGAVTYQSLVIDAGGDDSPAYASEAHPYRHFVLIAQIPASGSTSGGTSPGTGGGGSSGGGGGGYTSLP
jgi:uncharacterized membrane protein YgcG